MKTSERVRQLKNDAETLANKRFFNARTTAAVYEQSFHNWVERQIATLETSVRPRDTDALDLRRLDAEQWADRTFAEQKIRNPGIREAEGITLDNIVKGFNAVQELLLELNALRPANGLPSLQALAEQGLRVRTARTDLHAWIKESQGEVPSWMFEMTDRLLRGDEG